MKDWFAQEVSRYMAPLQTRCSCGWALQAYIGPPSHAARYAILRSCIVELRRAGIVAADTAMPPSWELAAAAHAAAPQDAQQPGRGRVGAAAKMAPPGGSMHTSAHVHVPRAASAPADGPAAMDAADASGSMGGPHGGVVGLVEIGGPLHEELVVGNPQGSHEGAKAQDGQAQEAVSADALRKMSIPRPVRAELDALTDVGGSLTMALKLRYGQAVAKHACSCFRLRWMHVAVLRFATAVREVLDVLMMPQMGKESGVS